MGHLLGWLVDALARVLTPLFGRAVDRSPWLAFAGYAVLLVGAVLITLNAILHYGL
jgi:hypothetical protein